MTRARSLVAVLTGSTLLALTASSSAAPGGASGLPPTPGNPLADLQQQIDDLRAGLQGEPVAVTVDCGAGETVSAALASTVGPVAITVLGTCTENVVIGRDDVAIQGGAGAGLTAASAAAPVIRIDGARRVSVRGLTLTGGDAGLQGTRGATWDLSQCAVHGGARFGVVAANASVGTVDGCTVAGSGGQGIVAANQSVIHVTNSAVESHAGAGITAIRGSHVRIGQDLAGTAVVRPVAVRGNGQNGITVADASSASVVGGAVESNGGAGIFVGRGSAAQIGVGSQGLMAGVAVQGNGRHGIAVESGQATILGSTISGNDETGILVSNGAAARIGIADGNSGYAGNAITANGSNGVHVVGSSSAFLGGNLIDGNGTDPGALLGRSGIAVITGSAHLAGRNTVINHPGTGIFVARGSAAFIGDPGFGLPVSGAAANVISGNGAAVAGNRGGIFAFQGGVVDVRDAVVTGNHGANLQAFQGGQVEVRRGQVEGAVAAGPGLDAGHGIAAGLHSLIRVRGTASVTGNAGDGVHVFGDSGVDFRNDAGAPIVGGNGGFGLQCLGTESSYSGDVAGVSSISPSCTGF